MALAQSRGNFGGVAPTERRASHGRVRHRHDAHRDRQNARSFVPEWRRVCVREVLR